MNEPIVEQFIQENEAWEDMISRQRLEMPGLSDMLNNAMLNRREVDEEMRANVEGLKRAIEEQERDMTTLQQDITGQRQYLIGEKFAVGLESMDRSLDRQKRLRERIRRVVRGYFELKSMLLNYLWSIP